MMAIGIEETYREMRMRVEYEAKMRYADDMLRNKAMDSKPVKPQEPRPNPVLLLLEVL